MKNKVIKSNIHPILSINQATKWYNSNIPIAMAITPKTKQTIHWGLITSFAFLEHISFLHFPQLRKHFIFPKFTIAENKIRKISAINKQFFISVKICLHPINRHAHRGKALFVFGHNVSLHILGVMQIEGELFHSHTELFKLLK